jgi:hypothetical protein
MTKLTYAAIASLDGYVEVEEDRFGWATPDEEVCAFVNDLVAAERHLPVLADASDGIQREDVMNHAH